MSKMIRLILWSGLFLLVEIAVLNAQERSAERKSRAPYATLARYTVSVEPLNILLNGGWPRLNVEKRIGRKEWAGLTVTGYRLPANRDFGWETLDSGFESFTKLNGIGLGGTYKYYFLPVLFAGAGASYTYYDVQYPTADFYGYVEDGLTYYEFGTRDTHQHFNRLATNACVGVHTFRHAFFVEVTLGLGYAYGFYDESKRRYNEVYGFGYRGLYPVFGLKLGVNLK